MSESQSIYWTNTTAKLGDLLPWTDNPKTSTKRDARALLKSWDELGQFQTVAIGPGGEVYDGHQRLSALLTVHGADYEIVARQSSRPLDETERRKIALYSRQIGAWDWDKLSAWEPAELMEWGGMDAETLGAWKRDVAALDNFLKSEQPAPVDAEQEPRQTLAERFGVPPFSVLDARQGYWQKRKAAWIGLGIQSEIGRGDNLQGLSDANDEYRYNKDEYLARIGRGKNASPGGSLRPATTLKDGHTQRGDGRGRATAEVFGSGTPGALAAGYKERRLTWVTGDRDAGEMELGRELSTEEFQRDYYEGPDTYASGTSIFDPVLCELAYRWFSPKGGAVFDPFAGGSVRGVVAALLGYDYTGIDLRAEQIQANEAQAAQLCQDKKPRWFVGDSVKSKEIAPGEYDFIFSCPPYGDLEIYSEEAGDLSNMGFDDFVGAYRQIIAGAVAMLKDNRFACFVVGDFRDKKGFYRNFPALTIDAFQSAGMTLYNEAILVTAVGSLSIRVGRQFQSGRKLGKTHQNVLVFYKGNPKAIKSDFGDVEFGEVQELQGANEIPN